MNLNIILSLFVLFLFVACNGKNKEKVQVLTTDTTVVVTPIHKVTTEDNETEETPAMSGWKCYGLLGRVKSVEYANGDAIEFNNNGNLTKSTTVWLAEDGGKQFHVVTNVYSTPNRYSNDGSYECKIEYKENTRYEIEQGGEYFRESFTFDSLGRVIKSEPNVGFDHIVFAYKYKSKTDKFPYKVIQNASYEGGAGACYIVSTYEYLKIDSKGNWTERKVVCKTSAEDEENKKSYNIKTTIEKRDITYF